MDTYVTIAGNVGSEVTRMTTANGAAWARFRLGCTPRIHRDGQWRDLATTWITVKCWRQLAENVASSIAKGDPVFVEGRLRTEAWVDAAGAQQEQLVIEANVIGHDLNRGTSAFKRTSREVERSDTESGTPDGDPAAPSESAETPAEPATTMSAARHTDQRKLTPAAAKA